LGNYEDIEDIPYLEDMECLRYGMSIEKCFSQIQTFLLEVQNKMRNFALLKIDFMDEETLQLVRFLTLCWCEALPRAVYIDRFNLSE
jgi:hypothetical protein